MCLLLGVCPLPAWAQAESDNPGATAALHLGPLAVQPTFGLTNVGVDSNVFHDSTNRRDFTATIAPGAMTWLRVGPALLSGTTKADWVYFAQTTKQRSLDFSQQLRLDVPMALLAPYIEGEYVTTRQRPNPEIDARARRHTTGGTVGTAIRLDPLMTLDLSVGHSQIRYDAGLIFDGVDLGRALDQQTDHAALEYRLTLTPLTTLVFKGEAARDRFTHSPIRNADSFSVQPGFEFKPLALVSGSAFAGYKKFTPRSPGLPAFSGAVAAVQVVYAATQVTRVAAKFNRDVTYSFEPTQPYYLLTGGGITLTQLVAGNWDAVASASRQRLDYRNVVTPGGDAPSRADRVMQYGLGFGYRLRIDVRIGVSVNYESRQSPEPGRTYSGYSVGGSFTYGS